MSKPVVAATKPKSVDLKKGETYHFCTCGKSANQPFCDGSHSGTDFKPKSFKAEEGGKAALCQCKQTANPPYCDGSHVSIPDDKVGEAYELERDEDKDSMPKAKATPEEPTVAWIHEVAEGGLEAIGHHGPMAAMGIATQKPELRKRLKIDTAAERLARFLETSVALMQVMARACGHNHLNQFNADDLASWDRNTAELAGIEWSGFDPTRQS